MTQKELLVELLKSCPDNHLFMFDGDFDLDESLADHLLDNGVRRVVRCYECEYLGFKGLMDGYCKKYIMGLVSPNDYCSRGKLREKKKQ